MIAALRCDQDSLNNGKLSGLAGKVDWSLFLKNCRSHKVMMPVFYALTENGSKLLPENIKEDLDRSFVLQNTVRNLVLADRLLFIIDLLDQNNITALPFKGPVLSSRIYGDFAQRQPIDLDILISKSDAADAVRVLTGHGFEAGRDTLDQDCLNAYLGLETGISLVHPEGTVAVDLHWDMAGRFVPVSLTLEDLSGCREVIDFNGRQISVIRAEELLCYLSVHGARHCWRTMDLVCCIAGLVRTRPDLDWERVFAFARKLHAVRALCLGLYLAVEILGIKIPDGINEKIKEDNRVEQLGQKAGQRLFSSCRSVGVILDKFHPFLFQIHDSIFDGIRYGVWVLFSPTIEDYRTLPVSRRFHFVLYLVRPVRLVLSYLMRQVMSLFLNHKESET